MRVTNVEMFSAALEESIDFSLQEVDPESKYMIRAMVGLDAEEIIPKFYSFSTNTKAKYYDFSMKPRDLVIRVVLNPNFANDEDYGDLRDELYRAISATRTGQVELHFHSGGTLVSRLFGYIVKFEVPYFVKLPEVQITVRCNDPMFRAINPVILAPAVLGTTNPIKVPDSLSTAPHGFIMQVTFTATSPSFTIQDVPSSPEWKFTVTPSGGFLSGDVLYFSSEFSNKYLYLIRSGSTIQLADKVAPTSLWPVIFPGLNSFHFPDLAKISWNTLRFYAAYWGV
jgi:hypothetical protein